jgi:glycine cleavage system protein P-like pyridoxal-binding family
MYIEIVAKSLQSDKDLKVARQGLPVHGAPMFQPSTNDFPLIVHEALMIEPTETENKDTLDAFADALIKIAAEAKSDPELLHNAPHNTKFGRMDEVKAARELVLCCWLPENYENQ